MVTEVTDCVCVCVCVCLQTCIHASSVITHRAKSSPYLSDGGFLGAVLKPGVQLEHQFGTSSDFCSDEVRRLELAHNRVLEVIAC